MTQPPLPDVPTLRAELAFLNTDSFQAGSRLFFQYSGGPPSALDCQSFGTALGNSWSTNIALLVHQDWSLNEVDVLDIATYTGHSSKVSMSHPGGYTGATIPASAAANIEFLISRRYRGGKPRMFSPPPGNTAMQSAGLWLPGFLPQWQTGMTAFIAAVVGQTFGSIVIQHHINLSYYHMFDNVTDSSGRIHAAPRYKATATSDIITGYALKQVIGSQRRRRTATTP